MDTEIECPSGMVGVIRPLKVRDEGLFSDAKLLRSGRLIPELVSRCWVSLKSPGPYGFPDGKPNWEQVLQGDVFYIFLQIRRISYGDGYTVTVPCRSCNATIEEEVLLSGLRTQALSEDALAAVRTGTGLSVKLDGGPRIQFRLLTQADDKHLQGLQQVYGLPPRFAALARRVTDIEGKPSTPAGIVAYIQDLAASEADEVLQAVEAQEAGVDFDVTLTCGACGMAQVTPLPLSASFFRPNRKKQPGSTRLAAHG